MAAATPGPASGSPPADSPSTRATTAGTLISRRGLQLAIEGGQIGACGATGVEFFGAPDSLAAAEAEAVARALSPYRLGAAESQPLTRASSLSETL